MALSSVSPPSSPAMKRGTVIAQRALPKKLEARSRRLNTCGDAGAAPKCFAKFRVPTGAVLRTRLVFVLAGEGGAAAGYGAGPTVRVVVGILVNPWLLARWLCVSIRAIQEVVEVSDVGAASDGGPTMACWVGAANGRSRPTGGLAPLPGGGAGGERRRHGAVLRSGSERAPACGGCWCGIAAD